MPNPTYIAEVRRAARFIRSRFPFSTLETAVILGSGLGRAVPQFKRSIVIPYGEIPGFPRTTVSGHAGRLILGTLGGTKGIAVMQGRSHFYEGVSMESIVLPIRALRDLGVKTLIVTAAVGSMRKTFRPGHIVVVKDHINLMWVNPLRGSNALEFGERFPDLSNVYDAAMRRAALKICRKERFPAAEGVYTAVSGPSYETPAEVRAFRMLGGDVVGMSVAPEAIVARQMGVRVLALSWVSNMAAGLAKTALTHSEVLSMGGASNPDSRKSWKRF